MEMVQIMCLNCLIQPVRAREEVHPKFQFLIWHSHIPMAVIFEGRGGSLNFCGKCLISIIWSLYIEGGFA